MDNKIIEDFLYSLLHGHREGFEICELIMEALSYKKAIPESFWVDELKGGSGILGKYHISKKEMRDLRTAVITAIVNKISLMERKACKEIQVDNFSRLFHALTILEVEKNCSLVPAISENLIYNIAYSLWNIDDGTEKNWHAIDSASWYAAEAFKNNSFTRKGLLTGMRHK